MATTKTAVWKFPETLESPGQMHLSTALYKEEMDQHPLPAHQVSIKVSLQAVPVQTQNLSSLVNTS